MNPLQLAIVTGQKDNDLLTIIDELEHLPYLATGEQETLRLAYLRLEWITREAA